MTGTQIDFLFSALAHAGRRRMLDLIMAVPGMSMKTLASHFDMSRIAVLKHVRVLEEANLIRSKKEGRTRHLFFNPVPMEWIYDRWTTQYSTFWSSHITDIKARAEKR